MIVKCSGGCGEEVSTTRVGVYREVTGFEQVRADGGANVVHDRRETGRVFCPGCFAEKKLGTPLPGLRA